MMKGGKEFEIRNQKFEVSGARGAQLFLEAPEFKTLDSNF